MNSKKMIVGIVICGIEAFRKDTHYKKSVRRILVF